MVSDRVKYIVIPLVVAVITGGFTLASALFSTKPTADEDGNVTQPSVKENEDTLKGVTKVGVLPKPESSNGSAFQQKQNVVYENGLLASFYLMGSINKNLPRSKRADDYSIYAFADYQSEFSAGNFLNFSDLAGYDATSYTGVQWDGYIKTEQKGRYIFSGDFEFSGSMYRNTKCIFNIDINGHRLEKWTAKDQIISETIAIDINKELTPVSFWINCSGGSNPGQINERNARFSLKWKKPNQQKIQAISRDNFVHEVNITDA